jgi:pyroglutamyl-peptidase
MPPNLQPPESGKPGEAHIKHNPAQEVVANLSLSRGQRVVREVLPVSYRRAALRIRELLCCYRPRAVILVGYAARSRRIRLETRATVGPRSQTPDIDGCANVDFAEPRVARATAPIKAISHQLTLESLEHKVSADAGRYVCDYAYHVALCAAADLGIHALLIHIPRADDQAERIVRLTCETLASAEPPVAK